MCHPDAHVERAPSADDGQAAEPVVQHVPVGADTSIRLWANESNDVLETGKAHHDGAEVHVSEADIATRGISVARTWEVQPSVGESHDEADHSRELQGHVQAEPEVEAKETCLAHHPSVDRETTMGRKDTY